MLSATRLQCSLSSLSLQPPFINTSLSLCIICIACFLLYNCYLACSLASLFLLIIYSASVCSYLCCCLACESLTCLRQSNSSLQRCCLSLRRDCWSCWNLVARPSLCLMIAPQSVSSATISILYVDENTFSGSSGWEGYLASLEGRESAHVVGLAEGEVWHGGAKAQG
ncbi:hypothetical protein FGO68_gene6017 [Halteria grandinella]|uniref:Uncharacterized protein n=1 Tax=Halteria grandinella TaxID=5974 RepID=A0A8J8SW01_HALGN|nr:hypothetical protein FGO68_gene6017 [Halteria grandinella]